MSDTFPIDTWNHFENKDDRTNNRVESYNLSMKKFVSAAHPDIHKAVKALKGFETTATANFNLAKMPDARQKLSRRQWHDRENALRTYKDQYIRGKFKNGLSDYLEEIVNMFLFDMPTKKAKLLEDSDEDHIFDSSDPESDRGSDIELNLKNRETNNPSDDDAEIPIIPTIRTEEEVMLELDILFGDDIDTTASYLDAAAVWVQPSLEDLCKSFVEDPDVAEEQASIVTSMPETPLFDNNNNCVNYTTSQLEMIYYDTPMIGASSTINPTKKRKRQMDDNVCNEVKKLKDDTGLTSCNWCGNLYKGINRHRNYCKNKPTDSIHEVQSKKFVSELL